MAAVIIVWLVSIFIFPLASAFSFGEKICIGYRTVARAQVEAYEAAGNTLVWDPAYSNEIASAYGKGVYLTPGLGQWEGSGEREYCLVAANKYAFANAAKVRMPAFATYDDDCEYKPFEYNTALMTRYINTMGGNAQSDIRILHDTDRDPEFEIILPISSLNQNGGGLHIETICRKTMAELPRPVVDIEAWPWNNAVGSWESWSIDGLLPGEDS